MDMHIRDDSLNATSLHRNQFTYQTDIYCELAIDDLTRSSERVIGEKKILLGTFLDIKDVFHNTTYNSITCTAEQGKIETLRVRWTDFTLWNRITYTFADTSTKEAITITRGPHGDVVVLGAIRSFGNAREGWSMYGGSIGNGSLT